MYTLELDPCYNIKQSGPRGGAVCTQRTFHTVLSIISHQVTWIPGYDLTARTVTKGIQERGTSQDDHLIDKTIVERDVTKPTAYCVAHCTCCTSGSPRRNLVIILFHGLSCFLFAASFSAQYFFCSSFSFWAQIPFISPSSMTNIVVFPPSPIHSSSLTTYAYPGSISAPCPLTKITPRSRNIRQWRKQ